MLARKALAGTAGAPKEYVEDVFSTYLYTGNSSGSSTQTITNNIDLAGDGGLVWIKQRDAGTFDTFGHVLVDSERGITKVLKSNSSAGEQTIAEAVSSFNADGFTAGVSGYTNMNTDLYVSWAFRKAEKFFDIVTYSGNSVDNRTISHNLGSTPGCVIVARRSGDNWFVYHRSLSTNDGLRLDTTSAASSNTSTVKSVSSTTFTVGTDGMVNTTGSDYVAYLFAHDAGGFGDAGSDSIIKCGSYTGNGSTTGPTVTLDWEPQWLMIKASSTTGSWQMIDNMRGMVVSGNDQRLIANSSSAELSNNYLSPTATGFELVSDSSEVNGSSQTYIYIAIRRGPMKTPTSGTSVFQPTVRTGTGTSNQSITGVSFPPDLAIVRNRPSNLNDTTVVFDKLRGVKQYLITSSTGAETTSNGSLTSFNQDGVTYGDSGGVNGNGDSYINWLMRRAPGFFDVVCYTGTGSNITINHNLTVVPEMIIGKTRSAAGYNWVVYHKDIGNTGGYPNYLKINSNEGTNSGASNLWGTPTSTTFTWGTNITLNTSGSTYVAYLFASCPGVSKIGTYTGNGSSVTVTTDFQPRFILVKRTDSTGDWLVSDSARGLVAGNDPYLELNTTDAEVTNEDWVDISSTSFTVNQTTNNANVNTGTYIYFCIA